MLLSSNSLSTYLFLLIIFSKCLSLLRVLSRLVRFLKVLSLAFLHWLSLSDLSPSQWPKGGWAWKAPQHKWSGGGVVPPKSWECYYQDEWSESAEQTKNASCISHLCLPSSPMKNFPLTVMGFREKKSWLRRNESGPWKTAKTWLMKEGERFLIGRKDTKMEMCIGCMYMWAGGGIVGKWAAWLSRGSHQREVENKARWVSGWP